MVEGSHAELSAICTASIATAAYSIANAISASPMACALPSMAQACISLTHRVAVFIFTTCKNRTARCKHRRLFVETPPGAEPDGAIVDAEGYMWSAHWAPAKVVALRAGWSRRSNTFNPRQPANLRRLRWPESRLVVRHLGTRRAERCCTAATT